MNILDTKCTFKGCRILLEADGRTVGEFAERMRDVIDERNGMYRAPAEIPLLCAVTKACKHWDIPECFHADFKRITLGASPQDGEFFRKIWLRPHYRKALIQCLKEMKF